MLPARVNKALYSLNYSDMEDLLRFIIGRIEGTDLIEEA